MSVKETSEGLERAIDNMCKKTKDLRRQLRKAVVDHVSDRYFKNSFSICKFKKYKKFLYSVFNLSRILVFWKRAFLCWF